MSDVKPCRLCGKKPSTDFDQVSCVMCGIDAAPDAWNRLMAVEEKVEAGTIYWRRKDGREFVRMIGDRMEFHTGDFNWKTSCVSKEHMDMECDRAIRRATADECERPAKAVRYWIDKGDVLWRMDDYGFAYFSEGWKTTSSLKIESLEKYATEITEAEALRIINGPQPATPNPADLSEREVEADWIVVFARIYREFYRNLGDISGEHNIRDFPRIQRHQCPL